MPTTAKPKRYDNPSQKKDYRANTPTGWAFVHFNNLVRRTVNGGKRPNPGYWHYHAKQVRLDMTYADFKQWVFDHWHEILAVRAQGQKASLDRIDSSQGYALDNIRILSLSDNCARGGYTTAAKRAAAKMKVLTTLPLGVAAIP